MSFTANPFQTIPFPWGWSCFTQPGTGPNSANHPRRLTHTDSLQAPLLSSRFSSFRFHVDFSPRIFLMAGLTSYQQIRLMGNAVAGIRQVPKFTPRKSRRNKHSMLPGKRAIAGADCPSKLRAPQASAPLQRFPKFFRFITSPLGFYARCSILAGYGPCKGRDFDFDSSFSPLDFAQASTDLHNSSIRI